MYGDSFFLYKERGKLRHCAFFLKIMRPPLPLVHLFHILLPSKKRWLLGLLFIFINNHFQSNSLSLHLFFFPSFFLLWHFNASDLFQHIMKTSSAFSWFPHFWVLWQRMLVDLVKLENVTLLFILWWMHIHEYSSMQKQLQAVLKRTITKVTLKWFSPGVVFRVKHGKPILAFKKTSFFVSENN